MDKHRGTRASFGLPCAVRGSWATTCDVQGSFGARTNRTDLNSNACDIFALRLFSRHGYCCSARLSPLPNTSYCLIVSAVYFAIAWVPIWACGTLGSHLCAAIVYAMQLQRLKSREEAGQSLPLVCSTAQRVNGKASLSLG